MLKKGDKVTFNIGNDKTVYEVLTDEYIYGGIEVVELKDYPGEVATIFLNFVEFCDEGENK